MGASSDSTQTTDDSPACQAQSFSRHEDGKGIHICKWVVRGVEGHIATTAVEEQLAQQLAINLPGMLFDTNALRLRFMGKNAHPINANSDANPVFELSFTARDALSMVGSADPSIRVRAAARWVGKNDRADVEVTKIEHASDWTFSTKYKGTINPQTCIKSIDTTSVTTERQLYEAATANQLVPIDYTALKNTQLPILYSSHIILFEDELDDNGISSYKVRIRVMPTFFFILARFFLRVDGVLLRVYDTRYYHRFGTDVLVRETSSKEARLDSTWAAIHPSSLRDPDDVSSRLPKLSSTLDNINLPS